LAVAVSDVRDARFRVIPDPQPDAEGHVLIVGRFSEGKRRRLALKSSLRRPGQLKDYDRWLGRKKEG